MLGVRWQIKPKVKNQNLEMNGRWQADLNISPGSGDIDIIQKGDINNISCLTRRRR